MYEILLGGIGLRPHEVTNLEPEEVAAYISGFLRYRKQDHMAAYESGRLAGFISVMPYLPKHVKSPSQVIKFEWDGGGEIQQISEKATQWFREMDKKDVEAALRGDADAKIKEGSKAFNAAVKRLENAGIQWQLP